MPDVKTEAKRKPRAARKPVQFMAVQFMADLEHSIRQAQAGTVGRRTSGDEVARRTAAAQLLAAKAPK